MKFIGFLRDHRLIEKMALDLVRLEGFGTASDALRTLTGLRRYETMQVALFAEEARAAAIAKAAQAAQ